MDRPQPRAEIVTKQVGDNVVWITTASGDACEWVERTAPQYGELYPPGVGGRHYDLFVSDTYSTAEVVRYLESYNERG